jgi:UDP-N-acetylmuramoylalanine--D-glutamate ligase
MITMQEKINIFKDKNILVVGLARSGTGAANLLYELGAKVTITDTKPRSVLKTNIERLFPTVKVITEGNPSEVFDEADMIVISPGVPLDIPPLESAKAKQIPVIGELELAYQVMKSAVSSQQSGRGEAVPRPCNAFPDFIGITGTNGKSTTTTLVDLMLREAGLKTLLGGNIGIALTEEILKFVGAGLKPAPTSLDYIVAEISSFQLETIKEFRPKIAAILNITPDHLDRYHSMEEYIDAKARIFENQKAGDSLILNADDPALMEVRSEKLEAKNEKPYIFYFSRCKEVKGAYFRDGVIYFNLPESVVGAIHESPLRINVNEIRIQGVHNIENAMAASLVALIAGCSFDAVINVLRQFPGLEHRLEFVSEIRGVKFINDSKGTNAGAVAKSLEGFNNVILIMGGLDKGSDFSALKTLVGQKVKTLILIGMAKEKIAKALGGATETLIADNMNSAVELSLSKASAGDVVLLSPGCASFDMFQDFEDRGRKFKESVKILNLKLQNENFKL